MANREPTAAAALYPHLPGQSDYVAKWAREGLDKKETTAQALYGRGAPFNPQLSLSKPPNEQTEESRKLVADLRELKERLRIK